jgi:hypothetical protein
MRTIEGTRMLTDRIRSMEIDLGRITGVDSARIQIEGGEISEIHVIADPSRRPKWVVRDVITTLFARYGVRVPHQRVSVAGAAPAAAAAEGAVSVPPWRIRVYAVHLAREGDTLRATVELRDGDRSARASHDALATRSNQVRVVAAATLDAVRTITSGLVPLHLEDARRIHLGALPVVLTHVILLRPGEERSLVGSCTATEGRLEAAAGAVLDAVNRILQPFRAREEEVEYEVEEEEEEGKA